MGIRQSPAKFARMVIPYMAVVATVVNNSWLLFECVISLAVDDITSSLNELFFDCILRYLVVQEGMIIVICRNRKRSFLHKLC